MPIDIEQLSEAEMIDLNRRIVERLRMLQQMRAHSDMLKHSIGDRVAFMADGSREIVGVLTKYNRKTVSILEENGQQWNVAPSLLYKPYAKSTVESVQAIENRSNE